MLSYLLFIVAWVPLLECAGSTLHFKKPVTLEKEKTSLVLSTVYIQSQEECNQEMKGDGVSDGPWVPCHFLPEQFIFCEPPTLAPQSANGTKDGCTHFGGVRYEDVARTNVSCKVLACIECYGPRTFMKEVPCIKYTGHYFLSTLLYSVFLGVLAVDRFCLGYSAIAVGKLMTLGGLGIWWIIDIVLLVTGNLMPADDSNWEPYY